MPDVRTGMLRGPSQQRAARIEVDTGTGSKRIQGGREGHLGRGSFVNFYEDLGISTTQPAANQIRTEEKEFQTNVGTRRGQIAGYEGQYQGALSQVNQSRAAIEQANRQLQEAYGGIPDLDSAVNSSWNSYRSSFVPVRVVNGNNIEATYMLPREAIDQLNSQAFNRGDGSYTANWVDGGANYNVDVRVKGQGGARGAELHQLLRDTSSSLESQYRAKAAEQIAPQIALAQQNVQTQAGQLSAAQGQLALNESNVAAFGSQVEGAKAELQGVIDARQAQWDALHERYQERQDKMNSILSSINFGGAK